MPALRLCLLALPGLMFAAHAADDLAAERVRLQETRKAVETRYRDRVADCERRFFSADCTERARKERRDALEPLDDRLETLDRLERERRAAERRGRVAQKEAARQAMPGIPAASEVAASGPRKPLVERQTGRPEDSASKPAIDPAERAAREARARERYQRNLDEVAAHRAEVERRNAQRDKPTAAPLPPLKP